MSATLYIGHASKVSPYFIDRLMDPSCQAMNHALALRYSPVTSERASTGAERKDGVGNFSRMSGYPTSRSRPFPTACPCPGQRRKVRSSLERLNPTAYGYNLAARDTNEM
jgi:hypothetical protein